MRKPNAQQSLLEGAAIARRAERRRLAGLAQQGDADGPTGQGSGGVPDGVVAQGAAPIAWVGCQWLMEGYCGRAEEAAALPRRKDPPQQ